MNRGAESLAEDDETIGSEISLLSVAVKALLIARSALTERPYFELGRLEFKTSVFFAILPVYRKV